MPHLRSVALSNYSKSQTADMSIQYQLLQTYNKTYKIVQCTQKLNTGIPSQQTKLSYIIILSYTRVAEYIVTVAYDITQVIKASYNLHMDM